MASPIINLSCLLLNLLTGDFNACPPSQSTATCGYDSTAYKVLQRAPPALNLRSVYNEDLVETLGLSDGEL